MLYSQAFKLPIANKLSALPSSIVAVRLELEFEGATLS
jgi:hypothetical protein